MFGKGQRANLKFSGRCCVTGTVLCVGSVMMSSVYSQESPNLVKSVLCMYLEIWWSKHRGKHTEGILGQPSGHRNNLPEELMFKLRPVFKS